MSPAPRSGRPGSRGPRGPRDDKPRDEFDQATLEIRRVARVMKGGKRMSFRATVVVGDGRGRVGFASAKGRDVSLAITKAQARARRHLLYVPLKHGTIPHEVRCKFKAATVLLKPARAGQGIIAGGVVRTITKLLGAQNIVSKVIRGSNKITIANATFSALSRIHGAQPVAAAELPTASAYTS